jgi:hypothetical protein
MLKDEESSMGQINNTSWIVAVVFITGFAIQQALQILDPVVVAGIARYKKSRLDRGLPALPGGMADADFKKAVLALLSFLFGMVTVLLTGIRLLIYLNKDWSGPIDVVVTSLVVGSGTEAVNTVLKFLGYVKDAQKPITDVEVAIIPSTVTVSRGNTVQFRADVKNTTNGEADWQVLQGNGGSISSSGLYTAPPAAGTFQIIAISKADPTKSALATVTVV